MKMTSGWLALAALFSFVLATAPGLAGPAVGSATAVTDTVTVVSIDPATSHVVVKTPAGETFTLRIDPRVHDLSRIKPGHKISATYYVETAYAVSKPGEPLPKDTATILSARAAHGQMPASAVVRHMVVTGAVVGIDRAHATLKIVSPKGGRVDDFEVVTPEGQQLMLTLKVGDKITAWVTEALLIEAHPS